MNQEKIGRFIAQLRKEKNMTQNDLAKKLGITDRAISKWENGRGMPDLSLLTSLCETLDISINELLSGSRLDKKEYQDKLEENIINTIDYSNKKIKKEKRTFKICLSIILIFIILLIAMYRIDINRMENNKQVLFSTWGYDYTPSIDLKEEKIELAIMNYLIEQGENEEKQHNTEKTFASFKVYLIEEKESGKKYNVYTWVLSGNYYLENGEIKNNGSISIPYKFVIEKNNDEFVVANSQTPRDGSYYSIDMKNIFPNNVRENIENASTDGTIEKLQLEINEQVKLYFQNK